MEYQLKKVIALFIFIAWLIPYSHAWDNAHFYRAPYFWGEPRFERAKLSTWQAYFGWAYARTGRNSEGKRTNILDIYGPYNMHNLAAGVPNLDPNNPLDNILINLNQVQNVSRTFGTLAFNGKFHSFEILLEAYQNICNGFFLHTVIPIRKLKINHIEVTDLTPASEESNPAWQQFRRNFNAILERQRISIAPFDKMGLGDITLTAGWARNYEDTETLDFVDIDARIGVLFPSGKPKEDDAIFSLPLGYNKHYGVPLTFNSAIGLWDWLTAGFHISALFLVHRNHTIRIKTDIMQSGLIKLAQTRAKVDPGSLLNIQLYLKADHVTHGLSAYLIYHFNYREPTTIINKGDQEFDKIAIASDQAYHSWRMHSMQFGLEYDCATKLSDIGPRLGLFYNHVIDGKRIFNADLKYAYIGFDVAWVY